MSFRFQKKKKLGQRMTIRSHIFSQFFTVIFFQNLWKRLGPNCHFGSKKRETKMAFQFLWFLQKTKQSVGLIKFIFLFMVSKKKLGPRVLSSAKRESDKFFKGAAPNRQRRKWEKGRDLKKKCSKIRAEWFEWLWFWKFISFSTKK